jgi:hypothetical protein
MKNIHFIRRPKTMKRMIWTILLTTVLISVTLSSCRKQQESLPDLVVEDISCMGGNLYITVQNQGDGSLPENWISLASLYLDGVVQEDILLNKPSFTADGGISEPKGISSYLLSYDVSAAVRVDFYLDYNDEIKESDEENNRLESLYIGPCLLPDLRIRDIYLDEDSQVVVVVENIGPGNFPLKSWIEDQEPECKLRIINNKEEFCVRSIFEFDPNKALENVEGVAVFPTGLKISEESAVTAIIDCSDMIEEQNKENNVKTVILNK